MEISFNDIAIVQGQFHSVDYTEKEYITFDKPSVDGNLRHLLYKVVNGVIQAEKTISLKIINISETELDNLYNFDGNNEVLITINNTEYTCNMSVTDGYGVFKEQFAREARVLLKPYDLPRTLELTAPILGSVANVGIPFNITWTVQNLTGNVTIELYNGSTWSTLSTENIEDLSYIWTVPDLDITNAKIRLTSVSHSSIIAESEDFIIEALEDIIEYVNDTGVLSDYEDVIEYVNDTGVGI